MESAALCILNCKYVEPTGQCFRLVMLFTFMLVKKDPKPVDDIKKIFIAV